jgi:hypothetical protein
MKMEPVQLFTKCIIKPNNKQKEKENIKEEHIKEENKEIEDVSLLENTEEPILEKTEIPILEEPEEIEEEEHEETSVEKKTETSNAEDENIALNNKQTENNLGNFETENLDVDTGGSLLEEITLDPNILESSEVMEIKQANEVYYKMYKEAMKRARLARDLALNSYLEAKNIKNKHMLDESLLDSDESDLEKELDMNED